MPAPPKPACSIEPAIVVAKHYGVSDETVRKWRKRGDQAVPDRSTRPRCLAWRMTQEERAIICAGRLAIGVPLDDPVFLLRHFLPHFHRDSIYRVLKAEGLNRRPPKATEQPVRGKGASKTMISDLSTSTLNISPSFVPQTATYVSASSLSQSIAAHALYPSKSTTPRMSPIRLPSSRLPGGPSPSVSSCADGSWFLLHRRWL